MLLFFKMNKNCSKCKTVKPITDFTKNKRRSSGYAGTCKICRNKREAELRRPRTEEEKVKYKAYMEKYREKNKEAISKTRKAYNILNSEKNKVYCKAQYAEKKEEYKEKYGEQHKISTLKSYYKNKEKWLPRIKKYRRSENERIKSALRVRLRYALKFKNSKKQGSAIKDLGCTVAELKIYLSSQFKHGMTWDNWGVKGWHIDHIIPLSRFNLSDRNEVLKAVHYTNLQPLWAKDNLSKSNKLLQNVA